MTATNRKNQQIAATMGVIELSLLRCGLMLSSVTQIAMLAIIAQKIGNSISVSVRDRRIIKVVIVWAIIVQSLIRP